MRSQALRQILSCSTSLCALPIASLRLCFYNVTCLCILRGGPHSVKAILNCRSCPTARTLWLPFPGNIPLRGVALIGRARPEFRRRAQVLVRARNVGAELLCRHPRPVRVFEHRATEELLRGQVPSDDLFAQAGAIAAEDCAPIPDGRGPADYKRHLAGVLT